MLTAIAQFLIIGWPLVVVLARERLKLIQKLRIIVQRLLIMNHSSLRRWLDRGLIPVIKAKIGTAAYQNNNRQSHRRNRTQSEPRAIHQPRPQLFKPVCRGGLTFFIEA